MFNINVKVNVTSLNTSKEELEKAIQKAIRETVLCNLKGVEVTITEE